MKKYLKMNLGRIRWQLCFFLCVILIGLMLTGCAEEKTNEANLDRYEKLEEIENAFLVFYDPSAHMLLQSFTENHPEIEIKKVELDYWAEDGLVLQEMIKENGPPDVILARMQQRGADNALDLNNLPKCYEKGYIADLGVFCASDTTLDTNAYFPGTFEVFQTKDHLYALPMGITMDFMITTESKYNESTFSELEDGYTGRALLEVLNKEVDKNRESGEFFCPEYHSATRLLYQLGGITQTEEGIQVDEEIFKQVYEYTYWNNKQIDEAKSVWAAAGREFSHNTGYLYPTAFEPRAYEGKFTVSMWNESDAPAVVLSYAATANQYHLEESTKAIYIPSKDDGLAYNAKVELYGMVGAESSNKELSYDLLRMLMDEKISYFQILDVIVATGLHGMSDNFYPVNKERAMALLEEFENRNAKLFYGQLDSGRFLQMLDIVEVSEEEKEKHNKMLNGINGMFYWDDSMAKVSDRISEYQYAEIEDCTGCYAEIVEILNSDLEN